MEISRKVRDMSFDVLKGIATLIVVLGHVLQYSIKGYENSLIFNIIWSLQIPLFMIISGYFSISNNQLTSKKLRNQLLRYLWPCVTYFIVLCVAYHYKTPFLSAYNLLWHLEGTLWYLVVLAILSVFNFVATNASNKMQNLLRQVLYSIIFFGLTVLFAVPGLKFGWTFLGIKYVLYYSLFYWLGHMWRFIRALKINNIEVITDIVFAGLAIIYFYIICNVNLYAVEDSIMGILPRVIASISGVYLVCYVVVKSKRAGKVMRAIAFVGQNSLEIYYIHCVLIRSLESQDVGILSANGIFTLAFGFMFIMVASIGILQVIRQSEYLYGIIFGAKIKMGR